MTNYKMVHSNILKQFLFFISAVTVTSCSNHINRPMSSSLTTLTSESSITNTKLINYSELLSVAGLLPMPDVGVMYYQPEPSFFDRLFNKNIGEYKSVGVARNPAKRESFKIVGVTQIIPDKEDVMNAAAAIELLNEASAKGISDLIEKSVLSQKIDNLKIRKVIYEDDTFEPLADDLKYRIDAENDVKLTKTAMLNVINKNISILDKKLKNIDVTILKNETNISKLKVDAIKLTSKPGLIIAQWTTKTSAGGGVSSGGDSEEGEEENSLDSLLGISASVEKGKSGLVVIGGVRLSSFYVAEDYMKMLASTSSDGYRALLGEVGITTSIMQTKFVSYTSNTNISSSIKAQIKLKADSLYGVSVSKIVQGLDAASLNGYLSNVSSLSNKGNIGGMKWSREIIDFKKCAKNTNTESSAKPNASSNSEYACEFSTMNNSADNYYNDWITLQAVQSRLDNNVIDLLLPVYNKEKDQSDCKKYLDYTQQDKCLKAVEKKYAEDDLYEESF